LILTHGEDMQRSTFAKLVASKYGIQAEIPKLRQTIEIE
jgi:predicted metal-dependent RNase